jgi:hypothetical protein
MVRETNNQYAAEAGGNHPPSNWTAAHNSHYGNMPSHLEGLNYQGPLSHHNEHHQALHLTDHQANLGDAFLRQEFLASNSLSPTASEGPTSPLTGGTSANGFFGMLDSHSNAGDEIITAAIEEDKRRRNTAASARFRMKKKEREADLERRTRDMSDRCEDLQKRISALETENRWLRELITERSRNRGRGTRTSPARKDKLTEKAEKASGAKDKATAGSGLRTK